MLENFTIKFTDMVTVCMLDVKPLLTYGTLTFHVMKTVNC